ncbi:MAG: cellulase family glycosylhydrolase [Myxococcota bacterium]
MPDKPSLALLGFVFVGLACGDDGGNADAAADGAATLGGETASADEDSSAGSDDSDGSSPITAVDAAADMANGFNVGNAFDFPQHPRTFASAGAMIDAYYDEGFRTVRLPVSWIDSAWAGEPPLAATDGTVDTSHPRLAEIESTVDHALDKGMYVVLDLHHENWLYDEPWSDGQLTRFEQLWSGVCEIFADRPYQLIFEAINEPHGTIENDSVAVQALNQTAYDVIRGCGGNNAERILVIDGGHWGSRTGLPAIWPEVTDIPGGGEDPYVMASVHYYEPLVLTHGDDASGVDTMWSAATIANHFQFVENWSQGQVPIFLGEFGINWDQHAHVVNDNIQGWMGAVADECRTRGWGFAIWDDGGWFRVMDRQTQQFNGLQDAVVP